MARISVMQIEGKAEAVVAVAAAVVVVVVVIVVVVVVIEVEEVEIAVVVIEWLVGRIREMQFERCAILCERRYACLLLYNKSAILKYYWIRRMQTYWPHIDMDSTKIYNQKTANTKIFKDEHQMSMHTYLLKIEYS